MSVTELGVEICSATEENGRLIMAWRNDPETLAASYHRAPKVWGSFSRELAEDYYRNPDLPPIFVLDREKRVGVLKFEPADHPLGLRGRVVDLSINLAPEARGRGIGVKALGAALGYLRGRGVDSVIAEVRRENQASLKVFAAAGFKRLDETLKHIEDTGEDAPIIRFAFELTPAYWRRGRVFVIAEAGSNWRIGTPEKDREMARRLIDTAIEAGADAVKFQVYRPETVYVANAGGSDYLSEAGIEDDISDIFAHLAMPYEMIGELADYCRKGNIEFMSTPFSPEDFAAVDPYVGIHKVASYEISHVHLITLAATSGKPTLMSTGASAEEDIAWAVDTFIAAGGQNLCLMQCTARYPAPVSALNVSVIPWLKKRFGVAAGLSDHSRDPLAGPVTAVAEGARVIEKHFTMDNDLPGPDHAFALTPPELVQMVTAVRRAEEALGSGVKTVLPEEAELASYARRGLQAIRAIEKGEVLRENDAFAILRPGGQTLGVHPKFLGAVEGKRAARDISLGEGLKHGDWVD
ncbi:MAG: GNAT family N-acetyltransferase [Rhodospirillales bacterium]